MSQASDILDYLKTHEEGITPIEALRLFGCMRLAARIADLKAAGHTIAMTEEAHEGGRHARYRLVTDHKDRRLIRNMHEYAEYVNSPHYRHAHRAPTTGCEWCQRIADEDARFDMRKATPAEESLTLWGRT